MSFWKKGAVSFNIECDIDKTFVRELKPNEIDSIIDSEYKVTEGLYKFNIGDDRKSVFVDRNQIYEMVSEKYFYACLVFKYDVHLDKRKIKRYKLTEDDTDTD